MIRINLLDIEKQKLNAQVAAALATIRSRTYGDRNPHLGKMRNCPVCEKRHRGSQCEPRYALGPSYGVNPGEPMVAAQNTRKGVYGARAFAKKRFHPHPSKSKLQLVQRTQELYPQNAPYLSDPQECMEESRAQAKTQLAKERKAERKLKRDRQKLSRRINYGLN